MRNPYFENVMLNGLPAYRPGQQFLYNGMGYNLAGRAMERLSGKSIWRLFHEDLYQPLGIEDVPMEVCGSSARLTARELATLSQVLANRGSYGDLEVFSEATYDQLVPTDLADYFPAGDRDWGIGFTWFRDVDPAADPSLAEKDRLLFSDQVVGHGSATSCVMRADPVTGLVVAQVRPLGGAEFGTYLQRFLTEVAACMQP